MFILDKLHTLASQSATQWTYIRLADNDQTKAAVDKSYIQVWLSAAYLRDARVLFKDLYPATESTVSFRFGDGASEESYPKLSASDPDKLGPGVQLNYELSPLVPYRGGTVALETRIVGIVKKDYYATTLKILQDLNDLVSGPVGTALKAVDILSRGIQALWGVADGEVRLVFQTVLKDVDLGAGYLAVIKAPEGTFKQKDKDFSVQDGRLYYKNANVDAIFEGYDYLLLRIDVCSELRGWRAYVEQPFQDAQEAMLTGTPEEKRVKRQALALAIYKERRFAEDEKGLIFEKAKAALDKTPILQVYSQRRLSFTDIENF